MLQSLYLHHFRSYDEIEVSFSPKSNLFYGSNAEGKTNLLEAIFFLSTGRSFRTHHLSDLIRENENFFFIEARFQKEGIDQRVRLSFEGQTKKMEYNQTTYHHFTNLLGLLPTVLIAPEDVELITGIPAGRRRFLDLHLAQIDPLYVHHLARYHRALKQRNFLLRRKKEEAIESWETILLTASSYIHEKRKWVIGEIQRSVAGEEKLELRYLPSLAKSYRELRGKEMAIGTTLFGPHRDDIAFHIDGKEAKVYASQGQKRSAVAALRLSQWRHFYQIHGTAPILSIDDFGVHLDENRCRRLLEEVQDLGQIFFTSTTHFPAHKTFKVASGQLLFA